jgi:hypothetical protein
MSEDKETKFTDKQEKFLKLLETYPINKPETIVYYISSMGEDVLENPEKLLEALAECEITPVRRRQVWRQWCNEQRITIPQGLERKAGLPKEKLDEVNKGAADDKTHQEGKYSVDNDTGDIKVASTADKTALTWDEAEKLSKDITKKIEARKKAEADAEAKKKKEADAEGKPKEGPFTMDAEGNLQVREGASLTAQDVAVMNAVGKAQEGGDKRSAMEILTDKVNEFKTLQGFIDGGGKKSTLEEDIARYEAMKKIFGGDDATNTRLQRIEAAVATLAEGGGSNEQVTVLYAELKKLRADLQEAKEKAMIDGFTNQMKGLEGQITNLQKQMVSGKIKGEYDIMGQGLTLLDNRLGGLERTLTGLFGKRPAPLSASERKAITEGLGDTTQAEQELLKAEEAALFGEPEKES